MTTVDHIHIAIFATGAGSNAKAIIQATLQHKLHYKVALIVTNNPNAGVLQVAQEYGIPTCILNAAALHNAHDYIPQLKQYGIAYIILAGFLLKIPTVLIQAYPKRIINIHPALLPKYGGKGMYGHHVHQAVIYNKEAQSGITIHLVNEVYDAGLILFQATCVVTSSDTIATLADKVHRLEHAHYAGIIDAVITSKV